MKIVITGSLGNISRPLTKELVQKGHSVTVITSKAERQKEIEDIGAKALVGSVEDVTFLSNSFAGADAVYCMLPGRRNFTGPDFDMMEYANTVANCYLKAILQAGIKQVVYLSSVGAHTNKGNGILALHYNAEQIMNQLPADVAITFMRPVGFYYNLYAYINAIRTQGVMASNYGAEDNVPWVSPIDIAAAITEEITKKIDGRNIRYVASEEITCNKIASVLGAAIGKPDLKWIIIGNEQLLKGMIAGGMNPKTAAGFVEMNEAQHNGTLFDDYNRNKPTLGKVKMEDFAKDFALAFDQK